MKSSETMHQKAYWETNRTRRTPDHPVVRAFSFPKIKYVREYIDIKTNTKILDVGCGNGFFTYPFSSIADVIGVDISRRMLHINPVDRLVQGSARSLPFKDKSFEVVFCSNLLHHIDEPKCAVLEMSRVSRRYVVLSEPNRNNPLMALFSAKVPEERGALKFSIGYMCELVESCGLAITGSCSMGAIVPNKTPERLLSIFQIIDRKMPFAFYNILISQK